MPVAVRYQTRGGGWTWLETVGRRITDEQGRPVLVTNSRDVTARLLAEDALDEAQPRYRETLDTIQVAALTVDVDARIVYVNDRLLEIVGRTREELLGRSAGLMLLHPDDPEAAAAVRRRAGRVRWRRGPSAPRRVRDRHQAPGARPDGLEPDVPARCGRPDRRR